MPIVFAFISNYLGHAQRLPSFDIVALSMERLSVAECVARLQRGWFMATHQPISAQL